MPAVFIDGDYTTPGSERLLTARVRTNYSAGIPKNIEEAPFMSLFRQLRRLIQFLKTTPTIHAHCDIPCGIYDPHAAQIAALSVVRMDQLINELPKPASSNGK